tara:strand:+ start:73 stop:336 length:264 start_codon:yes stop_codon:yes gene_type:complete
MSKPSGNLYHPVNSHPEAIYIGFSWPNLFFGFTWFLYKSMWGWTIISFILAVCTSGISNLFFPFFANGLHQKHLLKSGYLGSENNDD